MAYKILKIFDHVMEDSRLLTLREKYLVSYVWSWQINNKCCFVHDEFLCSLLDLNSEDLHKLLTDLQKRRIIKINYGSARIIQVVTPADTIDCAISDMTDIFNYE